jgi:hypothetical protein
MSSASSSVQRKVVKTHINWEDEENQLVLLQGVLAFGGHLKSKETLAVQWAPITKNLNESDSFADFHDIQYPAYRKALKCVLERVGRNVEYEDEEAFWIGEDDPTEVEHLAMEILHDLWMEEQNVKAVAEAGRKRKETMLTHEDSILHTNFAANGHASSSSSSSITPEIVGPTTAGKQRRSAEENEWYSIMRDMISVQKQLADNQSEELRLKREKIDRMKAKRLRRN